MATSISLQSLLETHDHPFAIIDASLKILAVNSAYENYFESDRAELIGKSCCSVTGEEGPRDFCRHRQLFQDFEPYRMTHSPDQAEGFPFSFQIRGYPLIDADRVIYLGESILPLANCHCVSHSKMAGKSAAFGKLIKQLQLAASSNVPVLLQGETGTGKELAAEFVHSHSACKDGQFVVVDCTVLNEDLFESELFGHEKGAFTGAAGSKKGLFEMADQGTLFLDEIGELPLSLQPKLLRALESGTFRRVGGNAQQRSEVRVVSATHRNLQEMVRRGEFREDLYYRLAVFPVHVPALRERREDIAVIANLLLAQIGRCIERQYSLSPPALLRLQNYPFPGNIRELRNVLQLAGTLAAQERIEAEHIILANGCATGTSTQPATVPQSKTDSGDLSPLEEMEVAYIAELIEKHAGNRKLVAAEMNVSERTLYRKLKRYQLND